MIACITCITWTLYWYLRRHVGSLSPAFHGMRGVLQGITLNKTESFRYLREPCPRLWPRLVNSRVGGSWNHVLFRSMFALLTPDNYEVTFKQQPLSANTKASPVSFIKQKGRLMHWNYRIVEMSNENVGGPWYEIREVYYEEDGALMGHSGACIGGR